MSLRTKGSSAHHDFSLWLSCGELALYYKGTAAVIASTASVVLSFGDLMSRVAIVPTILHE
jgi:hypothetical protein